jgi:hypothetical protein
MIFSSIGSVLGFLAGVALTVGLLLSPHLIPGGWGYGVGYDLLPFQLILLVIGGLTVLSATLWIAGRMIKDAKKWHEPRVICAAVMIAFIANALFVLLVDLFALRSGWRSLIAVFGVPVIYGNLSAVLGKTKLKTAMVNIFISALCTMGAGFIIVAIIRGW